MAQIKAKHVFQALAIFFSLCAIAFIICSFSTIVQGTEIKKSLASAVVGFLLLVLGIVGPLRASLQAGQMPQEIKNTLTIVGRGLPICGLLMILAALVTQKWLHFFLIIALAVGFLILAYSAFYKLSRHLPGKFLVLDMIHIIKSSNVFGSKEESATDKEFGYWTKNSDEGLAEGLIYADGEIITLDNQSMLLSQWIKEHDATLPLVINFGSYTCPHHRMRIPELHGLIKRWKDKKVNFLTIYTAEARPEDGWKIENQYHNDAEYTGNSGDFCFYQAKTIEDRLHMAKWLLDKKQFEMPMVLDNMNNSLLRSYNSWPIRLYVIYQGKVAFCGKQGPFGYEPTEVDNVLDNLINNK